ncbi:MAG: leukotoxin LktA family filamentous adhesin, partial [Thiobacillus sp.]|nr:leukotoxin LktA family filamentous adhesin [Thiobacillus sp.]
MSYAALGFLRKQYLCVLRRCAWFNAGMRLRLGSLRLGSFLRGGALTTGLFTAAQLSALASGIVPDGRTQTRLTVNGNTTDITTQTIRGSHAYNSFSTFNVDVAQTVNLHLPQHTSNLLNLVHSETSYINGLVNAYQDGRIGGNVYFFNPHGVVVGAGSVINVGSLTLATPTPDFMDRLVSPAGLIDGDATAQALAGHIPLSQTGLVMVRGRVHARDAVTLVGGQVEVAAGAQVWAGGRALATFADLVNVEGLQSAAEVRTDGGVIRIVAAGDITVAGEVSADGTGENASGGSVTVFADHNATLTKSGRVSADAGDSGDGGFVEFSARDTVTLSGNGLSARASGGAAGTILIDPEYLTWIGSGQDFFSHGADITLTADKKITLDGVMLSSRNIGSASDTRSNHQSAVSQGDSGDITLSAKEIEIKNGSQLLAHADNGHAAGNITLAATDNQSTPAFGSVESSVAAIRIDNTVIKGGNVSIKAVANDKWVWTGNEYGDTILDFLGSLRVGANVTYSTAHATVDVTGGTDIDASGTLSIESQAIADASMKVMSTVVGFGYGETDAQAKVNIGQASLGSGGAMSLKSQADSTLSISVDTVNTGTFSNAASSASKYANFSFAVGIGNQSAETTVADNATITRAASLNVEASGKKSHSVNASGGSFKDGIASAGVSVLVSDTTLTASLGGNVTAGSVTVKSALAEAETEVSAAAGTAGKPDLQEAITSARPVDEILFEKLSDFVAAAPDMDQRSGASSKLGLSAAFAWADSSNQVKAEIANAAHVTTPGSLTVNALAEESLAFETSAAVDQRELDTQLPGDPNAPSDKKKVAISASVAVIDATHHADARIGDQAVIVAGGPVNVTAQSLVTPFWQQWIDTVDAFKTMDWNSATAWKKLGETLYDLAGDPVGATSWTQTAVESEKLAFAGTVDFFSLDQKATARIGDADINANVATPSASQDVAVAARAQNGILNLVGVPEFDPSSIGSGSSDSGSAGFGGAYHQFNLTGGTDASISRGATVKADDLVVAADTDFNVFTLAETVGKAGKVSINGAFSLLNADVATLAQIGSGVNITAGDVLVQALDDSLFINAAGGVARSQSVGIGFSVAINDIDRETRALVGNRAGETGSGGSLAASGNLVLDAESSGTVGVFSVAGSGPSANEDDAGKTGGDGTKTNAQDTGEQGKSGVGISGAASVNLVRNTTEARLGELASAQIAGPVASLVGVDLDADGTAERQVFLTPGVKALAMDDNLILAGAGSLTVANGKSAGLAGAFTWNQLEKDTRANIADTTVTVATGGVSLDARNNGALWSISAGGAGGDKVGIAGSVSYSTIDNLTDAAIDNAGVDAGSSVNLAARDESDIRSVAGSASYGGKAGVGAAVAINTVDSDTTARITGAGKTVNGDAGVALSAVNDNSIVAVAAAIGASRGVAVAGAVTWNVISNQTDARLEDATVSASNNLVSLDADDLADIFSISGNAAISTGQGAVGIAASYNAIDNETYARALDGSLSGTAVRLDATENADIQAIAAGGSGAAKVAASGSLGINTIGNITEASTAGTTINTAGDVAVRATDDSEILSITGAVGVAGNGAVGAAGSYNHIGSTVTASVSGGTVDAANVQVEAQRTATMEVWAVAGSGAGTAGFAGSIALNDIGGVTTARVGEGADVDASGNMLVVAESDDRIDARAGAIGVGGSVGAAGSIAFNNVHADTLAQVSGANTRVTGLGNGGVAHVDNGRLDALNGLPSNDPLDGRQQQDAVRGVAVIASSTAQVENFSISAGGGGSTGVAGTVSVAMMTGYTTAEVSGGAELNTQFGGTAQEARVAAYHHDNLASGSGGAAIGGDVGAGGAMDTLIASHVTTAQVESATLQGRKAVTVDAGSTLEIAQAIIGLGGGTYAGLSGSIGLVLQDGKTQSLVYDSELNARGDLTVEATSETDADLYAGAASVSGVAGIGLTASVTLYDQTTQAVVGDGSRLNAEKTTRIRADSDIRQDVMAGTASAAGGVGVAGTVNVAVIKGDTQAVLGHQRDANAIASSINADSGYTGPQQDVVIEARDETRLENYLGSVGIGLGGAGVGATADVVMVNNGATAEIRGGSSVQAQRDITVQANTERVLDSFTIAAAGGATTGVSGAVSVLTAGARPDADANSEIADSVGEAARKVSADAFGNQMDSDAGGTAASRDAANTARARANVSDDMSAAVAATSARAGVASGATLTA